MDNMVTIKPQNEEEMPTSHAGANYSLRLEQNLWITYKLLKMITNGFERVLGQGGFGRVYDGFLEDGTQVAVKLRSHSSNQGVKEFLAEVRRARSFNSKRLHLLAEMRGFDMKFNVLVQAQILTRIHHRNLVSMIGYCKDGEYMALVYEYMAQGTLREHIAGINTNYG